MMYPIMGAWLREKITPLREREGQFEPNGGGSVNTEEGTLSPVGL